MKKIKFNLKNKIIISIFLVIFIFGSIATYAVYSYTKKTFLDNARNALELSVISQGNEVGLIFKNSELLVQTMAEMPDIVDYLNSDYRIQDQRILQHLKIYNIGNNYSAIYLINKNGITIASTDESFVGNDYSFRDYFQEAIRGNHFVDVSIGVTSGELGYYFSHPIRLNENSPALGVAVVKLRPNVVNEHIKLIQDVPSKKIMLTDSFGVILYSNITDRIYKSLGNISDVAKQEIKNKKRFSNIEIKPLQYDILQKQLKEIDDESFVVEFFDEVDNENEIIVADKIKGTQFFLIKEEEQELYEVQATKITIILVIFVIFSAIFSAIALLFLIKKFFKPLDDLTDAVKKIIKGDIRQNINIKTDDEFEDLANNFNEMSEKLADSREDIELKILERTAELEKVNKTLVGRELKMLELKKEIQELKDKQHE